MSVSKNMRPQDIVVLLKIVALGQKRWRGLDLAQDLLLSASEVSGALERCRQSGLLDSTKRRVAGASLLGFLEHGLRFVFPAMPGALARGIPTAYSTPPLSKLIRSTEKIVWPNAVGTIRGESLAPLYAKAPDACQKDPLLHELLALADCLRIGRARERELAVSQLKQRLDAYALLES